MRQYNLQYGSVRWGLLLAVVVCCVYLVVGCLSSWSQWENRYGRYWQEASQSPTLEQKRERLEAFAGAVEYGLHNDEFAPFTSLFAGDADCSLDRSVETLRRYVEQCAETYVAVKGEIRTDRAGAEAAVSGLQQCYLRRCAFSPFSWNGMAVACLAAALWLVRGVLHICRRRYLLKRMCAG